MEGREPARNKTYVNTLVIVRKINPCESASAAPGYIEKKPAGGKGDVCRMQFSQGEGDFLGVLQQRTKKGRRLRLRQTSPTTPGIKKTSAENPRRLKRSAAPMLPKAWHFSP